MKNELNNIRDWAKQRLEHFSCLLQIIAAVGEPGGDVVGSDSGGHVHCTAIPPRYEGAFPVTP